MKTCDRLRPALLRSIEGEASPAQALRVARHLEACTACRIVAARARRLASALDTMAEPVAADDEAFFRAVMAALPASPPPRPSPAVARRLAWLARRRVHLAGLTTLLVLAGGAAAQSLPTWVFAGGSVLPRLADSPEQASGALSKLAAIVGVALAQLDAGTRLAPGVPHIGLAAATGLALGGLAVAGAGAAALAAAWRGRTVRT